MTSRAVIAVAVPDVPLLAGLAIAGIPGRRAAQRLALASAVPTAVLAVLTGVWALSTPDSPLRGDWLCVDAAGGALVGVIGIVGAASVALSPTYLAHARTSLFGETRPAGRGLWLRAASLAAATIIGFVVGWTQLADTSDATAASGSSLDYAGDLSW